MVGKVLSIAGSDSGGGAGVQADIKTITTLGGYAATSITAITAQDTLKVYDVHPVPVEIIKKQIEVVLNDIKPDIVKTGMLFSSEIIELVADIFKDSDIPLIVDPVMVATSGDNLLKNDAVNSMIKSLIPKTFLLTPNIPEAEILSSMKISCLDDMKRAGKEILKLGCKSVLLKGGHLENDKIYDVYFSNDQTHIFESEKIDSKNTHGTGCTLASAIACKLSQGESVLSSIEIARKYVRNAIQTAPNIGSGNGPLNHL